MTPQILWPSIVPVPPRTMAEMLYDAAVGLAQIGRNKLYLHLLFQVTTPSGSPFEAVIGTPEGDSFSPVRNEAELRVVVSKTLQRETTKATIACLLRVAVP